MPPVADPPAPALSVVVASVNGWHVLASTLAALDAQAGRERFDIIAVDNVGGPTRRRLRRHRPTVVLIAVDEPLAIPRLRHLGVRRARGEVVAIIEDHVAVAPTWAEALLEAHRSPWGAVAG